MIVFSGTLGRTTDETGGGRLQQGTVDADRWRDVLRLAACGKSGNLDRAGVTSGGQAL